LFVINSYFDVGLPTVCAQNTLLNDIVAAGIERSLILHINPFYFGNLSTYNVF